MITQRDDNLFRVSRMTGVKQAQKDQLLLEIENGMYDDLDASTTTSKKVELEKQIRLLQVFFYFICKLKLL